jgi:hypothetical protein
MHYQLSPNTQINFFVLTRLLASSSVACMHSCTLILRAPVAEPGFSKWVYIVLKNTQTIHIFIEIMLNL